MAIESFTDQSVNDLSPAAIANAILRKEMDIGDLVEKEDLKPRHAIAIAQELRRVRFRFERDYRGAVPDNGAELLRDYVQVKMHEEAIESQARLSESNRKLKWAAIWLSGVAALAAIAQVVQALELSFC